MTRTEYLSRFDSTSDAIEFENATLSSGDEFLPVFARAVRDGADGTPAYWTWLCGQADEARRD